jgi:hypothetical protein
MDGKFFPHAKLFDMLLRHVHGFEVID